MRPVIVKDLSMFQSPRSAVAIAAGLKKRKKSKNKNKISKPSKLERSMLSEGGRASARSRKSTRSVK